MQNAESLSDLVQADHDLHDFQQRAVAHETAAAKSATRLSQVRQRSGARLRQLPATIQSLPRRYALHLLIILVLPLGLAVNNDATEAVSSPVAAAQPLAASETRPALTINSFTTSRNDPPALAATEPVTDANGQPVGDGPITDPEFDESLVIPVSNPAAQPAHLAAQISVEKANLRNGPSTAFDTIDRLVVGTQIDAIAKHADWVQIRTAGGQEGWLSLELLEINTDLASQLPEAVGIPTPPPAKVGSITQDSLNLRDGPGTDYVSMSKLGIDSQVNLLARYAGWYQVESGDGVVGWVSAEFLHLEDGVAERLSEAESIPSANPAMVGSVNTDSVNLRSGPSTKYSSLGKMATGTELELLARYKDWVKVQTPKGTKGWISADLVDASAFVYRRVPYTDNIPALPKAATPRSAAPAAGGGGGGGGTASGDVASLAWQFVGSRYTWGGESPSGFDCSGLTRYLYRQVGVSLPHSAAGQYSSRYGTFVGGLSNLQPGDLLFYANTAGPGITHVGIYVGGGVMVNAMTPASGVGQVSIYSSYWLNHYYGALRPYR